MPQSAQFPAIFPLSIVHAPACGWPHWAGRHYTWDCWFLACGGRVLHRVGSVFGEPTIWVSPCARSLQKSPISNVWRVTHKPPPVLLVWPHAISSDLRVPLSFGQQPRYISSPSELAVIEWRPGWCSAVSSEWLRSSAWLLVLFESIGNLPRPQFLFPCLGVPFAVGR